MLIGGEMYPSLFRMSPALNFEASGLTFLLFISAFDDSIRKDKYNIKQNFINTITDLEKNFMKKIKIENIKLRPLKEIKESI
jgi:hypothetical protein